MTRITTMPVLEVEIDIDSDGFNEARHGGDARAVRLEEDWHYLDFMVVERAEQKAEEMGMDAYFSHNMRHVYVRLDGGTIEQYKQYLSNLADVLEEASAWVTIQSLEET